MALSEFFGKNQIKDINNKKQVPDGVWRKCEGCNHILFEKEFIKNYMVCDKCSYHHKLDPMRRIELLTDEDSFKEQDAGLTPKDTLNFKAEKSYAKSISNANKRSEHGEAIIGGTAKIDGNQVVIGVMDFRFIGGSMGSVVGEKISRLTDKALKKKVPLIIVCTSGGARMQEGMLSLMQMAKTSQAMGKIDEAKIPYIALLASPTMGGVTASFAQLADIIIAEPKALIGFTGPRVIEKTINERLPDGFQTAEFLKKNGMIDQIVHRVDQKEVVSKLIGFLG